MDAPLTCIAIVESTGVVCNKPGMMVGITCLCTRHRNTNAFRSTIPRTDEQFHAYVLDANASILRRRNLALQRADERQRMDEELDRRAAAAQAAAAPVFARRAPREPAEPLAEFAQDRQNVHRTESVKMTTDIVNRVLKITVPKEYRWCPRHVSKTVGEIITECRLDPHTCVQFINRYLAHEDIYNLGYGIYGRVLDGVWHYIKSSEHKADLCKILRSELKDNLGMCLQGNLTRICNVLAGYLDGVGSHETPVERLGRELPKLFVIEDEEKRLDAAKKVLAEVGLPEDEWTPWLEAVA
jgi:hypothetical protein